LSASFDGAAYFDGSSLAISSASVPPIKMSQKTDFCPIQFDASAFMLNLTEVATFFGFNTPALPKLDNSCFIARPIISQNIAPIQQPLREQSANLQPSFSGLNNCTLNFYNQ
jgi:hypothetical protein